MGAHIPTVGMKLLTAGQTTPQFGEEEIVVRRIIDEMSASIVASNVVNIVPGIMSFNPGRHMVDKPLACQRNAHAISVHGRFCLADRTGNELTAVTHARSWDFLYVC